MENNKKTAETMKAVEFRNEAGEVIDLWRGVVVDGGAGLRVGNGSIYKIGPNDRIMPVDPQRFARSCGKQESR